MPDCRAITKTRANRLPSRPCPYAAGPSGFCAIHNPATRIPRLEAKRARLSALLAEVCADLALIRQERNS